MSREREREEGEKGKIYDEHTDVRKWGNRERGGRKREGWRWKEEGEGRRQRQRNRDTDTKNYKRTRGAMCPVITALGKLRQGDWYELKTSLGSTVSSREASVTQRNSVSQSKITPIRQRTK